MSHIEKNDPNLEQQDQKKQESEPVIDEEFKKSRRGKTRSLKLF